jgi:ferrochelatase
MGRWDNDAQTYDALLVLSFGGPEGPDDVLPFLENVTRGRGVPKERLMQVADHYLHFGGISPINAQNRALISSLESELRGHGLDLPIYFGNRNWHPFLKDTMCEMAAQSVKRCLVLVTSAFSSYSGCRQYREDIARADDELGGTGIVFDKIRVFYNHPGFIDATCDLLVKSLGENRIPGPAETLVLFSAHSIPETMARRSAYESQLREAIRLVADRTGIGNWEAVFQSRSGSPHTPWLEPDVLDVIRKRSTENWTRIAIVPIGFISDHMEVLFDLDTEASDLCAELGVELIRVPTVGTHPKFIAGIRELILERMTADPERKALGTRGPNHDVCPHECCLSGTGDSRPAA